MPVWPDFSSEFDTDAELRESLTENGLRPLETRADIADHSRNLVFVEHVVQVHRRFDAVPVPERGFVTDSPVENVHIGQPLVAAADERNRYAVLREGDRLSRRVGA